MVDHEALKLQANEAYAAGSKFLDLAEGWTEIDNFHGFVTSIHPTDTECVIKLNGHINKFPEFAVKFISTNLPGLRERHLPANAGCDYVENFGDRSYVVRESTNSPSLGLLVHYKFYSIRGSADGSFTIVATTAKLPEYPPTNSNLNFLLINIKQVEAGSQITLVTQSQSTVILDEAAKSETALNLKEFYKGVLGEIQVVSAD